MSSFIEFDAMPTSTLALAELDITLPRLDELTEADSPVTTADLLNYLIETLNETTGQLRFVQTAKIKTKCYWLWQYETDKKSYYATVCQRANGDVSIGFEQNYGNWTPDQYLIGDYHDFFYEHWKQLYTLRYPYSEPRSTKHGS